MAEISFLRRITFIIFGCLYWTISYAGNPMVTVNGGYTNVVVAIGERVPENEVLLQKIKDDFTEASHFLFAATQNRLYFSEITILIPRSWTQYITTDLIQSERFETSDVIIDVSQEERPNRPFTNKVSGCGHPGRYIHLTPTFIGNRIEADKYGGYGKVISHEWAHYRWGLFDEYPRPGTSHFYAASNGHYEASRCTLAVQGHTESTLAGNDAQCDVTKGEPPHHCRFVPETTGSASLLYKQFLSKIVDFCDKDGPVQIRHNREAPNSQNIHCFGKSTRQVMKEHSDFKRQSNALPDETNTTPTFKVVKPIASNWVLVLDTSGSMKGQRLRQLRQAASNFINTAVQIGESLSVITFFGKTEINAPLTLIESQNSRTNLIQTLPTEAGGASNIGQGIQQGRAQLANRQIFGGRMLVITDGEETVAPFIKDIIHLLLEYSITVDTIAIGPETTDNLELLARMTGGQSYYHSDSSTTLDEAFKAFSERNRGAVDALITVFTKYLILEPNQMDTSTMIIDSSIGEDTQFIFEYSQGESSVVGVLIRPDSSQITTENAEEYFEDSSFSLTRITITNTATAGTWELQLRNTSPYRQNVTIILQSRARKDNTGNAVDPIRAKANWGKESVSIEPSTVATNNQTLFIAVSKGYVPVLHADVTATVTVPVGEPPTFTVYDDGLGADIQKNDGIYSAFLTNFKGEGRYGLNVMVTNTANNAVISPASVLGQGSVIDSDYEQMLLEVPAGQFQRVVNGGSFTCKGTMCSGTTDVFRPARILDLEAKVLNLTKADVTLTFTTPGDDLMTGTVRTLELRLSLGNIDILYDDFENAEIDTTYSNTSPARTQETYTISNLKIGPHSYFFAIVAIDELGHRSLVSNIASASMRFINIPGITWTEPPTTRNVQPTVSTDAIGTQSPTLITTEAPMSFTPLTLAIAVAAPLVALLLAIALIAFCLLLKKRKKSSANKENIEIRQDMSVYNNVGYIPESSTDSTRTAEIVSNDRHTEQPQEIEINALQTPAEVKLNTYGELPEKRIDYANQNGMYANVSGSSGLTREDTYMNYNPARHSGYDSDSSSDDDIAIQKRRNLEFQMQYQQ